MTESNDPNARFVRTDDGRKLLVVGVRGACEENGWQLRVVGEDGNLYELSRIVRPQRKRRKRVKTRGGFLTGDDRR